MEVIDEDYTAFTSKSCCHNFVGWQTDIGQFTKSNPLFWLLLVLRCDGGIHISSSVMKRRKISSGLSLTKCHTLLCNCQVTMWSILSERSTHLADSFLMHNYHIKTKPMSHVIYWWLPRISLLLISDRPTPYNVYSNCFGSTDKKCLLRTFDNTLTSATVTEFS